MSSYSKYFKNYNEFDSTLINFKELKESKGKNKALISYPSNGEFKLQTPEVEYSARGFPPKMEDEPDKDRNYFQLPLDPENGSHKILIDKMVQLDEHLNSENVRNQLFGKNVKKFSSWKVKPTIRNLDEEGKVPFLKANFDVDYNEGKIKTIVYIVKNDEVNEVPTSEYSNSIDDLIKIVPFRSVIRFQLIVTKIWTMASSKEYGVGFKITKMEVQQSHSEGGGDTKEYDFISSKKLTVKSVEKDLTLADIDTSDDEDKVVTADAKNLNDDEEIVESKKSVKKIDVIADVDTSDDEIVIKPKKNANEEVKPKKSVKKEDDSDEEVKPKKSVKKVDSEEEVKPKKPVKKEVDSDDSDEEIIRPVKALTDEDSDESDEEVIKPKKKVVKEDEDKKKKNIKSKK